MAVLTNINPANNPLAIKVKLDTVINNVSLNPSETYQVTIKPLNVSAVTTKKSAYERIYTTSSPYVYTISTFQTATQSYLIKIYLPLFNSGNIIYIVPAISDLNYQDQVRDFTSLSDLSTGFITASSPNINSWSQALEYWIFNVLGFTNYNAATDTRPFPSKTTKLTKTINLSVNGVDTNRADEVILANINFTALMKTFGQ